MRLLTPAAIAMMNAKYRAVLINMRRGAVALIAGCLLATPAAALAADYLVDDTNDAPNKHYVTLEALRQASIPFANGDTVTVYQNDSSLTQPFSFGAAAVTIRVAPGATVEVQNLTSSAIAGAAGSKLDVNGQGNLRFTNNTFDAGDGGAINAGTVTLSNGVNTFTGNVAGKNSIYYGGAINAAGTFTIGGGTNLFDSNIAGGGGAISATTVVLSGDSDNRFTGNSSVQSAGAINATTTVTISGGNNLFDHNIAGTGGGWGKGGAIVSNANTVIIGGTNTFTNNTAREDAGAIQSGNALSVTGGFNTFKNNTAGQNGGAIYVVSGIGLTGGTNLFEDNRAGGLGGAIYSARGATLTATDGAITFQGNTHNNGTTAAPNAMYLANTGGGKTLALAAKAGKSILFFDPVESDKAAGNLTIKINGTATDTGIIRFDRYQSNIYGNTTVSYGTLALTSGAKYGADDNTGSFWLANGARLSADAGGGTVNAGAATLKSGSTTAVDVSGGKLLTLNGNVTIENGAIIDVTGYTTSPVDVVRSDKAITGNFTQLKIGGVLQSLSTPQIDKFLNDFYILKTGSDNTITIKQGGLVWNNTDPGTAHGTFRVDTAYTLSADLVDNTNTAAYGFGWDGKTLTKTGSGTLTLTGNNSYTGGTNVDAGKLVIAGNSLVEGNTEVKSGAELALKSGATYGAGTNSGSFSVDSGARLSADADGGTVNAGSINLNNSSTTAVDVSGGNFLAANGAVSIGTANTTLNVTGFAADSDNKITVTLIKSDQAIAGQFTNLQLDGVEQVMTGPSLNKFTNDVSLIKTDSNKTISITGGGLVWNNTDPYTAHGHFNIQAGDFTLNKNLADNTSVVANNDGFQGWDGKTLTKTGQGNLILTGANTYTGGTHIDAGRVTVNGLGALGTGSITNNSELYFAPGAGSQQTIDFGSRYSGTGTIGLNASLAPGAGNQWADLVTFANAPSQPVKLYYSFVSGSDLKNMPKDGLLFASLGTNDGTSNSFDISDSSWGVRVLKVKTADNKDYYMYLGGVDSSAAKVYSESAAAGLAAAAASTGSETFTAIGKAAANAVESQTGTTTYGARSDVRYNTGSHADVKGNNVGLALAWKHGATTWGVMGQQFKGDYTTTHDTAGGKTIHANGDIKQHDVGLFLEHRPADTGYYYQTVIKTGKVENDFRRGSDGSSSISAFSSDRSTFSMSLGGGFVKKPDATHTLETYSHLIHTQLGSDSVTDGFSNIRFDTDKSLRLLSGVRYTKLREKATQADFYAGLAFDYEFRGKTGAAIDGVRADTASLRGLTGILELGFSAGSKQDLTIDGGIYGYLGKKQGVAGSLTLTKYF